MIGNGVGGRGRRLRRGEGKTVGGRERRGAADAREIGGPGGGDGESDRTRIEGDGREKKREGGVG